MRNKLEAYLAENNGGGDLYAYAGLVEGTYQTDISKDMLNVIVRNPAIMNPATIGELKKQPQSEAKVALLHYVHENAIITGKPIKDSDYVASHMALQLTGACKTDEYKDLGICTIVQPEWQPLMFPEATVNSALKAIEQKLNNNVSYRPTMTPMKLG